MRKRAKVIKAEKVLVEMTENFSQFLPPTEHLRFGIPLPWYSHLSIPRNRKAKAEGETPKNTNPT